MKVVQEADWKDVFEKNSNAMAKTFGTTDGKKTLEILRKAFSAGTVFDENPIKMARNAGQHELVQYIDVLVERGKIT